MQPDPLGSARLRIAQIVPNLALGGRERAVVELVEELATLGVESTVFAYDPLPLGTPELEIAAPVFQLDRNSPHFAEDIAAQLQSGGFDVAHAQGHIPAFYLAQAAQQLPGLATVATMHVGMTGTWRWAWPVRQALRSMDALTAVSLPMARSFARLAGRPVEVTPNGLALERLAGCRPGFPGQDATFRFACCARLVPGKRLFDAVAAVELLAAQGSLVELHIAGDGPLRSDLQRAAKDRPWLHLHGAVEDVPGFLARHHAFLIPSIAEGMPLAMMEAMAAGLPVVASDIAPLRTVGEGAALFAPPRDVRALAGQMLGLVQGEFAWHRASRAGRRLAEGFAIESVATDMLGRYRALARKTRLTAL